jgi:exonuclease SbcC
LDFAGKSLVGILGDTGAGKSTILEAITFALYGNPSWSNRDVAPLAADGATAMTVDFTFAHDGQRWRVRRIFHVNTTPTSHLLENLDTGERVDNGRAVNQRIVSLLNLNYDGFQAAVLLPQGRFDRLLTATGRERTDLLKGIFGTQMIETMHGQATEHRERLTDLLTEARLARGRLLQDPVGVAAEAGRAAEQAEHRAARLTEALSTLRDLQKAAITARGRRDELADRLAELDRRWVGDAAKIIGGVEPVERELTAEETDLATARQTASARRADAENRLAEAAGEGQTPQSLTSADTLLSRVPERLAELAEDRDRLKEEQRQLTEQNRQLESDAAMLRGLGATAAALTEASEAVAATATKARDGLRLLRDEAGTALAEAVSFARARQEQRVAQRRLQPCRDALPPLQETVGQTAVALRKAVEQLDEVRRSEAAHTLGADLSAGDACLVCERPLPGDYRPPAAIDPQALRAAERTKSACDTKHQQALNALNRAETTLKSALDRYEQRQQATEHARSRLDRACEAARNAAGTQVPRLTAEGVQPWDEVAFAAELESVVTSLADADPGDHERRRTQLLSGLLEPANAVEQALTQAATAARDSAHAAQIEADNAHQALERKRAAYELATRKSSEAKRRHATAERNLERDLRTLPGIAAQSLPADLLMLTAEHVAEARRIVGERRDQLDEFVQTRDQATGELTSIAERQLALSRRRAHEITRPLQSLVAELNRWAETIEEVAVAVLDATQRPLPPSGPEDLITTSVGRYAAALDQSGSAVRTAVHAVSESVRTRVEQLTDELTTRTAALRTGATRTGLAISLDDGVDLLDAAALDPVADAASTARNDARRLRADQAEAEGQIERARTLDAAIEAGNARYVAVDKLRALLAEAKFPQYLTGQRTRSLLGLASDLFGELSGGQFGFAEDFQIVSRHSGASRSPKTLSGGETFLASLALALALVELYSRSGARLGALFLDEGFGSLDVDTLARALAVLRAETGGDKLVTVISHLHAVAEAVEDVLWVERGPTGSAARWLDADERDALVREDVSAGLLSLA